MTMMVTVMIQGCAVTLRQGELKVIFISRFLLIYLILSK